jgi:CDP-diglyceride synthetase
MRKSYKSYSIGLVIAWGIALSLIWCLKGDTAFETASKVCMGFFLGWISTTIARNVYPKEPGMLG